MHNMFETPIVCFVTSSALPPQPAPLDPVEQYLAMLSPAWRGQSVVLPPSTLGLDEIRLEDLTLPLQQASPQPCS